MRWCDVAKTPHPPIVRCLAAIPWSVLLSLRYPTPFKRKQGRKIMFSLALQRRVDDREALVVLLEGDVGDAEHFAQLIVWYLHRAR
jgi:hypothetical protein